MMAVNMWLYHSQMIMIMVLMKMEMEIVMMKELFHQIKSQEF